MRFEDILGDVRIKPLGREVRKRISAYGIFIKENKLLLVKSKCHGLWEFPGGRVEKGESIRDALEREFFEETGFVIQDLNPESVKSFKSKFYANDTDEYFDSEMKFFIVQNAIKKQDKPIDFYEVEKVMFISPLEFNKTNCKSYSLRVIRNLFH